MMSQIHLVSHGISKMLVGIGGGLTLKHIILEKASVKDHVNIKMACLEGDVIS